MQELIRAVSSLDIYQEAVPVLHDLRTVDFQAESSEMISLGREPVRLVSKRSERRVALVPGSEFGYGMMSVVARLRTKAGHRPQVYRTISEALQWLSISGIEESLPEDIEQIFDQHLNPSDEETSTSSIVIVSERGP